MDTRTPDRLMEEGFLPGGATGTSLGMMLLPFVLSVIAGSVDVIGFLGLGGLFTAHITGNLVILAAHIAGGGDAPIALLLSVPVFMVALGVTRLLASGLESIGLASLRPLLFLQFLLLGGFLLLGVAAGPRVDPNALGAVAAGMLGVSAMAVQNGLSQILPTGATSTAVMTTNITRFVLDVGEMLLSRDPDRVAKARSRANHTWPAIGGFTIGCGLGAVYETASGLWSLWLPLGLALLAFAMTFPRERSQRSWHRR
jgi:uncharacterized membrane protein YoaK (UPF0700 family)